MHLLWRVRAKGKSAIEQRDVIIHTDCKKGTVEQADNKIKRYNFIILNYRRFCYACMGVHSKNVDYIETDIKNEFEIEELAEIAALSPFYFQRLFSRLVKRPVMEYIKNRRLALACDVLASKDLRIIDIALEFGFQSHSVFTKAFKDAYNMTPVKHRENPILLVRVNKPNLLLNYTMMDEGVPLISDGIVIEINRRALDLPINFMGITDFTPIEGQMPAGENTGPDLLGRVWDKFHKAKSDIPRKTGGREIDVCYAGDAPEGYFTFFVGAEIENQIEVDGFATWQMPMGNDIVCGFEAENFEQLVTDAVYKAWKYMDLWFEKHGLKMDHNLCSPEVYYGSSPESPYMELWISVIEAENK